MTIQHIPKPAHGSLAWLQLRHRSPEGKCIVGASEVATIMGCNPYSTVSELGARKLMTPTVGEQNDAMVRGNVLEPALLQHASDVLQQEIETPEVMYLHGRIIATLDGRGTETPDLIVEAKTSNHYGLGEPLPDSWYWQAQAQMHCTEAERIVFIILDRHLRLGFEYVHRDDEAIANMLDAVEQFCDMVDHGFVPDEETLPATLIAEMHPEPAGEKELDTNAIALIAEWQGIKAALSDLEASEKKVRDALARMLMDAEYGTVAGHRVISWKSQQRTSLDAKALQADHPEIAAAYMKQSSFRVMRPVR